ncbi:hypothetical protein QVD17_24911 [Tagetes erecta]|uniref:Uncharacterized protein n=1 Tax=Tagetes erecta TaxID=13708 RepID=A0AAD8KFW6_TARER|nr:hypothetical protein QVD17_24911 [Tagetes erecta]
MFKSSKQDVVVIRWVIIDVIFTPLHLKGRISRFSVKDSCRFDFDSVILCICRGWMHDDCINLDICPLLCESKVYCLMVQKLSTFYIR